MRFTFKHKTGSRAGQEQVIEGRVVNVGRNPTNLLSFDPEKDDRVSGNHAQLLALDDGRVVLSDLGSRNGTLVNGQKIQGQMPLASGTVVQFGSDGGPEVEVTFGAAPAAPAAPPPTPVAPKAAGGGGKLMLFGCCGVLLLGGCVVAGAALLFVRSAPVQVPPPPEPATGGPVAMTEAAPATEAPPEKTEAPPPVTEKPAVVDRRTAWGKLGVGSRFEQKGVQEVDAGGTKMKTEMSMVYVVKEVKDDTVVVSCETTTKTFMPNMDPMVNTMTNDQNYPAKMVEAKTDEKVEEPKREKTSVTVPAGTFDCWKYTITTKDAAGGPDIVTENYMADDEAVAYKTVTKGATMSMTLELVKMEKK